MATFNDVDSYLKALAKRMQKIGSSEKDFALIVNDTHADVVNRVFGQGKNSNNGKIGSYSTKPTLAGSSSFTTKSGFNKIAGSKTKRRKLKWATISSGGKNVALFEVPGGYKQIRSLDGRQAAFVDLTRSGELKGDFSRAALRQSPFVWLTGVRKPINSKKLQGIQEKYGNVFQPTKSERKEHTIKIDNLLGKIWNNA